jgi:hypothetical protein
MARIARDRNRLAAAVLGLWLGFAPVATARINVVTLPARDSVQLTIYNSVDLTLVKETRRLTLRQGLNRLEFSWANTLIDPTSVEFRALTHADEVEVLDVSFPPRAANTLEWRLNSETAGEVVAEIRYFTSGISWAAEYLAEAATDERSMRLAGAVKVTNKSGEDYENAQVRLIVGVVRLVEDIVKLARAQSRRQDAPTTALLKQNADFSNRFYARAGAIVANGPAAFEIDELRQKEITRENLSEYFIYTVEGRDTIENGWAKRLPSFDTPGIPVDSYYKFEKERWGDSVVRFYRFTNSTPSRLGTEPLPDGRVTAFRIAAADAAYSYVGSTAVKYIPVKEAVELELGRDPEVTVKPVLLDWRKADIRFDNRGNISAWTTRETWEVEVQNSRDLVALVDIRRNFTGDWTLRSPLPYENVDAKKVKFLLRLNPREKRKFTYELTTRHGTNATR